MTAETTVGVIIEAEDRATNVLRGIQRELGSFSEKVKSFQPQFRQMAVSGGLAFTALSVGLGKALNDFERFDTGIQRAGANTKASADTLKEFRKVAIEAARNSTVSFEESSKALAFLAGGSISAEDAMEALAETIKFGTANQLDLQKAAVVSSQAMSLFKVKSEEVSSVLDVLTRSGQVSFATTDQLADSFSEVAPIAAQLGVNIVDLTSVIGAMGDVGLTGSEAGVALKRAFIEMLTPSKQTTEALAVLGLTVEEVQQKMKNPIELIRLLEERVTSIQDPIQRASILSSVFGNISGPAMAALIGLGSEAIQGYADELNNAAGALDETAARVNAAQSPLSQISKDLQALALQVAEAVKPALEQLIKVIQPILMSIGAWVKENPNLAATILLVVTGLAGLLFVIGSLGLALIGLLPVLSALGTGFLFVAGSPILLIVAGLILVAAKIKDLIGWLYGVNVTWKDVWNEMTNFVKSKWDTIMSVVEFATGVITRQIERVLSLFATLKSAASAIGGGVSSAISGTRSMLGLAQGGIVTRPTLAMIGEGGEPEAVVPLSKLRNLGGGVTINILGGTYLSQEAAGILGDQIIQQLRLQMRI